MDEKNLKCTLKDFQEVIEDLPDCTQLIRSEQNPVKFPFGDEDLLMDCEAGIWVTGLKRKYFRKVLYAHFDIRLPDYRESYIIYFICPSEN